MSIVIIRQDNKIEAWKKAIHHTNPSIEVFDYNEEHPKNQITMALVWKHPPGSLGAYPNLKCIASAGAGVDFIFEDKSIPSYLPITRVVDMMLARDMSEHVVALIFAHLKNLNNYQRDQMNEVWNPKPYLRIGDFTVGILGLGELGSVLANDLVRFGFKTQGWSRSQKILDNVKTFSGNEELSDFLSTTEVLVCLLPLTEETKGILNTALFTQLPKGAYVINVARGGHLVDDDLLSMLDSEHLSGASLDVFHQEPLDKSHPFWKHSKIHITPHCASVSDTKSVVPQILENYESLSSDKPLINLVSREKGY
ncbi:glyoxylate/hydroxypyruvate reductase A [bacterium]|nr:glyoxylate/hydroxypyruvate reductase A [bacterium]